MVILVSQEKVADAFNVTYRKIIVLLKMAIFQLTP